MLASKKTKRGVIGAVVLAGVLAVSGFAFTDVLTVPQTSHGADGAATVEPVTVDTVHYTLHTGDPSTVDAITFNVTGTTPIATGGAVWVQPVGAAYPAAVTGQIAPAASSTLSAWYLCTAPDGTITSFTCDTTGAATPLMASDISQVRVVAAD